jgi:hypothetical protein
MRQHLQHLRSRTTGAVSLPLLVAALIGLSASPATAANVTSVIGSAYGYRSFNIVLLGGSQPGVGPTPTVTLASNASNSPQAASATTGLIQYGPAVLFTSDRIDVSTSGSLGANGSVTSSSNIRNINKAATQPNTGSEILTADNLSSTCTASAAGSSRTTRVTNGILQTDSGLDLNDDGDYTDPGEHSPVNVAIPTNPAANATHTGHIHLNGGARDDFRVVFNEQVTNADGSVSVHGVHEYFLGPSLRGDLIVGRAVCGVKVG